MKRGQQVKSKETGQTGKIVRKSCLSTKKRPLWVVRWDDTEYEEVIAEDEVDEC